MFVEGQQINRCIALKLANAITTKTNVIKLQKNFETTLGKELASSNHSGKWQQLVVYSAGGGISKHYNKKRPNQQMKMEILVLRNP